MVGCIPIVLTLSSHPYYFPIVVMFFAIGVALLHSSYTLSPSTGLPYGVFAGNFID